MFIVWSMVCVASTHHTSIRSSSDCRANSGCTLRRPSLGLVLTEIAQSATNHLQKTAFFMSILFESVIWGNFVGRCVVVCRKSFKQWPNRQARSFGRHMSFAPSSVNDQNMCNVLIGHSAVNSALKAPRPTTPPWHHQPFQNFVKTKLSMF